MVTDQQAAVAGVGMAAFRKGGGEDDPSLVELGIEAVTAALQDTGARLEDAQVDAAYVATGYGGPLMGQRILGELGLSGIPIVNLENACAGGATSLAEAVWSVRSGRYERVLAVGVEQLSRLGGGTLPLTDDDEEVRHQLVMPAVYAMRARRYAHEHGLDPADLAAVVVKNRANGARNPYARFQAEVTPDEVLSSRLVATPLTLLQCSANSDGASAVLVTRAADPDPGRHPIRVAASALTSGRFSTGALDMTWMGITERAVSQAYVEAGVGPADLDLCEVHDAFSIAEILYYEMLGLAERGEGAAYVRSGAADLDGRVPVNTSGGLLSRGHPVAATALAQVAEVVWQLRGEAGDRQVPDEPRVALTHVTGGGISGFENAACGVHVFVDDLV